MTSGDIRTIVNNVLRTAAQLSRGTSTYPCHDNAWEHTKGVKMPPLNDWIVESDRFDEAIASAYDSVKPGSMRKLIAPTGRGKSTYMPGKIAQLNKVSAMVLVPEDRHVATLHAYLKDYFPSKGINVTPLPLSKEYAVNPPLGSCVYYCTSRKLLSVLSRYENLFKTLNVDFVVVDEYHNIIGSNLAFYVLRNAKQCLQHLRTLAATATGPSDVNMKVKIFDLKVIPLKPELLTLEDPYITPSNSPMHHSKIVNRVIIFLPDDESIDLWLKYYENHDIPVVVYGFLSSSLQLKIVHDALENNELIVLLVTQVAETTFTFNVDTVIDTGYYIRAENDYSLFSTSLKRKLVSKSMRVQRIGRVGRFKPGTSYYFDNPLTPEIDETDPDICFEVYLWMKIFNVTLNDPLYTRFAVFGEVSPMKAAILLHSRIPPFLLFPYVANDGFFRGWYKSMKQVLYTDISDVSELSNDESVENKWSEFTARNFGDTLPPIQYKARLEFPVEWQIIPAIAYQMYMGADQHGQVANFTTKSVATAIELGARPKSAELDTGRFNLHKDERTTPAEDFVENYGEAKKKYKSEKPATSFGFSKLDEDVDNSLTDKRNKRKAIMSTQSMLFPPLKDIDTIDFSKVKMSDFSRDKVENWTKSVEHTPPDNELPVYDVGPKEPAVLSVGDISDLSQKYHRLNLKVIDPTVDTFKYHTFYPLSKDLFKEYMTKAEDVSLRDVIRLRSMVAAITNIGTLSGTKLRKYFYSAIRVHNSETFKYLQLTAKTSDRDFFDKLMFSNTVSERQEAKITILEACKILRVFANKHMVVGIDARFLKSTIDDLESSSSSGNALMDEYANTPTYAVGVKIAELGLDMGNQTCRDRVEEYSSHIIPHKIFGYLISNMWTFSSYVFSVAHALDDSNESKGKTDFGSFLPEQISGVRAKMHEQDMVIFDSHTTSEVPYVRAPVDGEDVLVLFWVEPQKKVLKVGGLKILIDQNDAFITENFHKGSSGALVVSADDGALLGFYISQVENLGVVSMAIKVFADLL